jgi:hypothetical protein
MVEGNVLSLCVCVCVNAKTYLCRHADKYDKASTAIVPKLLAGLNSRETLLFSFVPSPLLLVALFASRLCIRHVVAAEICATSKRVKDPAGYSNY